ncbi:hypothetical protein E4A47_01020 [Micrococcus flavus]|nr:hypothetical protein E4A47_01020 [Micrococcus flavus]GGK40430.1 hypothetical protein GCM10007073_04020 [Micrococcus flavus]
MTSRATLGSGPRDEAPTDAALRVTAGSVCGSDLRPYRGAGKVDHAAMGHDYLGEAVKLGFAVTGCPWAATSSAPPWPRATRGRSAGPATSGAACGSEGGARWACRSSTPAFDALRNPRAHSGRRMLPDPIRRIQECRIDPGAAFDPALPLERPH